MDGLTEFICVAFRAAYHREPEEEEIALHVASWVEGQTHTAFLEKLLKAEEREVVSAPHKLITEKGDVSEDEIVAFITVAYQAVLFRDPDPSGFENGRRLFQEGVSPSAYLRSLMISSEASNRRATTMPLAPGEAANFIRGAYEHVLGRLPTDGDVQYYSEALAVGAMSLVSLLNALGGSPEGRELRKQRGFVPLIAACGSLTDLLENMLRHRGMNLGLGRIAEFNLTGIQAEHLLESLVSTIEMLVQKTANAA